MHDRSYWSVSAFAGRADLDQQIHEMLAPGRERLRVVLAQNGFGGTTADLLRLAEIEMGRPATSRQELLHRRWIVKVDTLARRLRPRDSVLDCGSGFGTETIAFALHGAAVTAVDLFPEYLRLLEHRVRMYSELLGEPIADRVHTVLANLCEFEVESRYDYLWSNESIEHIVPLDEFLMRLPSWLRPGGVAVLCNDNALNPIRLAVVMRGRGSLRAPVREMISPVNGRPMLYAVEDIQTPTSVRRKLYKAGFRKVNLEFHNVLPSIAVRGERGLAIADGLERLASVPMLRYVVAGDYIILAVA